MRLRGTTGTSIKRDRVGDGCRHLSYGMDRMFACQRCGEAQTSRARSRPAAAPGGRARPGPGSEPSSAAAGPRN